MQQPFWVALICCSLAVALPHIGDQTGPSDGDDPICSLPPVEPGAPLCEAAIGKFTFNPATGSCEPYTYGGCGGTKNLFDSDYQCVRTCNRRALLRPRGSPVATADAVPVKAEVNESDENICSLPPVQPGSFACAGAFPKFTFNSATGSCEPYTYGGCGGTKNLFDSDYQCVRTCNRKALLRPRGPPVEAQENQQVAGDVCSLPPITPGPIACAGAFPKWTFNTQTKTCESYLYGGCRGTANLFDSHYDCVKTCDRQALLRGPEGGKQKPATLPATVPGKSDADEDICTLPPIRTRNGVSCFAFVPSWTFNSETGRCESYVYGGCGKTANLFSSEEDCKMKCPDRPDSSRSESPQKPTTLPDAVPEDICTLDPEPGHVRCLAYIPSWTYNSTSGQCEPYIYGGCGKSANLFKSKEQCNKACPQKSKSEIARRDVCLLKADHGPCFGWRKRFAFNQEKNRCEPFTYGGCRGNANNFKTAEECFQSCGGDAPCLDGACERVDCDMRLYRHYIQFGCRPVYKPGACCPSSFDCPMDDVPTAVEPQCFYRGNVYKVGESVPEVVQDQPCRGHCTCRQHGDHPADTSIVCAQIDCPPPPPGKERCTPLYTPGTCCPTSYECELDFSKGTCNVDNVPYAVGQYMKIKNQPCKSCICVANFTGFDGPGCTDIYCLPNNRIDCVPVYADGVCCPIRYVCPQPSTQISKSDAKVDQIGVAVSKPGVSHPVGLIPGGKDKWQVKSGVCLLPPDAGPCRSSIVKYYYNADTQACDTFNYGGCKGNENRFESLEDCVSSCSANTDQLETKSEPEKPSKTTMTVTPFITTPGGASTLPALIPGGKDNWQVKDSRCLLPMRRGRCRAFIPSFYFDSEQNKCVQFGYGGCDGNENRFETEEECMNVCKNKPGDASRTSDAATPAIAQVNPCELPQEAGPCRSSIPSYSYNSWTGECEMFFYGGCRGNANRFQTKEECEQRCSASSVSQVKSARKVKDNKQSRCQLPPDSGFCKAHKERFYYNHSEKTCKVFTYGGCQGNANNFRTFDLCMSECGKAGRGNFRMAEAEQPIETCTFGNLTLQLGDKLNAEDPCQQCSCVTPPLVTCTYEICPPLPDPSEAICKVGTRRPGVCCPDISCVSANPPSIDVCEGVTCNENQRCEVQSQSSPDGEWRPPIGVCVDITV